MNCYTKLLVGVCVCVCLLYAVMYIIKCVFLPQTQCSQYILWIHGMSDQVTEDE